MSVLFTGRARRLGDDIDTDTIIQSRRKRETLDPAELKRYLMEAWDPAFAATVEAGDILVAGRNFGCGSAMEVAVTVVLGAGIRAVVAKSFARTYFRNAINNGLLPVICDTAGIDDGETIEIAAAEDGLRVRGLASGFTAAAEPLPPAVRGIVEAGGLVAYLKRHGDFQPAAPAANTIADQP